MFLFFFLAKVKKNKNKLILTNIDIYIQKVLDFKNQTVQNPRILKEF